ncbi:diguanylate cyclase (GGDEF) domain-containing protein [Micromonospora viridifaciens]|uniref:Diguanylate cyclase (GGDEF) domain-containing protein n=1 Tax=Micromonospora viridifaciens TaxID=1881 RepID=A0A1C4ZXP6_MICVI|nr:diguanylate cyclase [Micromonospora viridifaciens]SCF37728.1 diguanylate cyclase (GGDEF) domain-containing protein [Micromonospora viridifaciens]
MTLRGRLTAAFLAVVLGPVLLGAFFAGSMMSAVDRSRSTERLGLAAAAVRTSMDALCQQLRAAADAVALVTDPAARPRAADQVVGRGLAAAVLITDTAGRASYRTPGGPAAPWQDCAGAAPSAGPVRALAARVQLRDAAGTDLGAVAAAQPVDPAFVARLAAVTGVAVTLLDDSAGTDRVSHTTETPAVREAVLAAARRANGNGVTETSDGRYVRRLGPSPGQPLPLVLSVPGERSPGGYAALVGAVALAAALAVLAAWRLARVTTRPLVELAGAVDRVTHGDLAARVPVRSRDEIGRLADAFNRMTRETGSYVAALTSSRDQLRGHLAVLGDTLASTHDLQRILRVILRSAIATTGARAGAVLLLDGDGVLVGRCVEGLDGRWPTADPSDRPPDRSGSATDGSGVDGFAGDGSGVDGSAGDRADPATLRVPFGIGVIGTVAATGVPQRGWWEPADTPTGEPTCQTYIAVPFAAPGAVELGGRGGPDRPGHPPSDLEPSSEALGVLALYDRLGADGFDDDDLVTLRTFAGHAAVAVENVRVHEEAQRLSLTDPLTGLWNYRYLRESIRREVERANRFGRMLSVLALDLDRFKDVNDTWGHAAGDAVLVEFARRVRGEIREVDLAFRQGGEEFVVLLPETDARGATIVAERLGAVVRGQPVPVHGHAGEPIRVPVTVSIGIAVYPDHAATGQQVLDAADAALYAAKAAGRDGYRLAPAPDPAPAREIPVVVAAVSPPDGLPRAGPADSAGAGRGGASSGPHPPRQSRGR